MELNDLTYKIRGAIFTVQGKEIDYKDICIDLEASVESEEPAVVLVALHISGRVNRHEQRHERHHPKPSHQRRHDYHAS